MEQIFKLSGEYKHFSKKQKAIYDYVIKNAYNISMMNAAQLSSAINVGEATLFRFLKYIGYKTYSDFKADVHAYALKDIHSNYWQLRTRFESDKTYKYEGPGTTIKHSIELLEQINGSNTLHSINQVVELMLDAPQTGILGLRSSKAVALYFEYTLLPFFPKINQLSNAEHYLFDRLQQFDRNSIVFIISGWPHTKNISKAAQFCHEAGIRIIFLTNNVASPIAKLANITIATLKPDNYYSIVPFIAIIEAIAVEIALRLSPATEKKLESIDSILTKYDIIDKNEAVIF